MNREIEEELACISKENYFLSLYHLSEYMEDQYQQLRLIQRSFIANHIVTHEHALHCLSLLFLGLVCLNMVFLGVSVPGGVLGFLNSLMVVGKSVLVVWRGRSLYYQELLLRPIRYEKSIKLLKYTRFAIGVGVILCYLLQLALPHLYPVTFFLEVLALPPLQRFISKLTQVVKSMLQLFILVQVIMITYAFSIYQKEAKGGREGSLMEVLKGLLSELVLIRLTTIEVEDPSSFPHLKQIPESLPVIMLILIYVEALFLASTILAYMREAEDKIEKCGVCGHSRTHLESLGTNFDHHISKEHSVWTYIKFFIFMRGERRRHGEERKVKDLIAKEDFKFLKV